MLLISRWMGALESWKEKVQKYSVPFFSFGGDDGMYLRYEKQADILHDKLN